MKLFIALITLCLLSACANHPDAYNHHASTQVDHDGEAVTFLASGQSRSSAKQHLNSVPNNTAAKMISPFRP